MTLDEYLKLQCDRVIDPGLKRILPVIEEAPDVLIYHACAANVYTASKRDCIAMTEPDEDVVREFTQWYDDDIFPREIEPLLYDFDYDYAAWYNHLTAQQQYEMDQVDMNRLDKRVYSNFCKKEKQIIDDETKHPKNRCICAPNAEYKYVLGPVVHMLEHIFKHRFKGYTSGKNWSEREQLLNNCRKRGLNKVTEGDGSGFDRTQYVVLKYIEFKIYTWLVNHNKIKHVDPETFLKQATMATVKIRADCREKRGNIVELIELGYYLKTGCTQTGNMDTTFANTLRQCLYVRFVNERRLFLKTEDYELTTSGDDFTNMLPMYLPNERISEAYYSVFSKQKTGKHGLGQVLKFLKFTDLSGIDFCSTETYYDPIEGYKIIRMIPRFMTLTAWSQKALGMTVSEQRDYMISLHEANKLWIGDLPILSQYNDLLLAYANQLPATTNKVKAGRAKKTLPTDPAVAAIYAQFDTTIEQLTPIFGQSEAYAMAPRRSSKNSTIGYYKMLEDRYKLTKVDVDHICDKLSQATDLRVVDNIYLPEFKMMCEAKQEAFELSKEDVNFSLD